MEEMDRNLFVIIITVLLLLLVMMMILVYSRFLRKKATFIIRQKVEQARFQKELSESQIEIKQQTMSYVGRELHDDLGQKLSVAKMMSNMVSNKLEGELKEEVLEINCILGECIQDIRNLSKVFIQGQVEFKGLIESIEVEVERIRRLKVPAVSLEIHGEKPELPKEDELILFRIVQECLNNSLKHSRARNLDFVIHGAPYAVTIRITDNGIGFSPTSVNRSGLANMEKRAAVVGANFHLYSSPGEGTVVKLVYRNKK